jgi:CDP-2,3-bis-(O-geranylgeranyl)-sn-glycerol synthase
MVPRDPIACGVFLLAAFSLAGIAQTAWFRSRWSARFAVPLDGGRTWRGRRILGANKTLRGFLVMVPATAVSFALLVAVVDASSIGLWPLPVEGYAALGAWAGFGFMAGELPNSCLKRQLGIAPGGAPAGRTAATIHFLIDRLDSGVGTLGAMALVVPVPMQTVAVVLLAGPFIHWSFSAAMFQLGIKARAA